VILVLADHFEGLGFMVQGGVRSFWVFVGGVSIEVTLDGVEFVACGWVRGVWWVIRVDACLPGAVEELVAFVFAVRW